MSDPLEITVTPIKVGPMETIKGRDGDIKKWPVVILEDAAIDGALATYSEKAVEDLKGRLGQAVLLTIEGGKEFNGVPQYRITKTPGWEKGQGGGFQRTGGRSVEERAEIARMNALTNAVSLVATLPKVPEGVERTLRDHAAEVTYLAGLFEHYILDGASAKAVPEGTVPARVR